MLLFALFHASLASVKVRMLLLKSTYWSMSVQHRQGRATLCLACRRSHTSRWGGCAAHIVCASIWTLLRLQGIGCRSHRRHWSGHSEALGCGGRACESSCQGHQQSCESSPPLQPALHDFERCILRAMLCSANLLLCSGYLLGSFVGLFGKSSPRRCDITGKFWHAGIHVATSGRAGEG